MSRSIVCASLLLAMCTTSSGLTIDDFRTGEIELLAGPEWVRETGRDPVTAQFPLPSANVAGGLRQMKLGTLGFRNDSEGTSAIRVTPSGDGVLSVASDFGAENFWLRYGYTNYVGPARVSHDFDLNLDLLETGLTTLVVDFLSFYGTEESIPDLNVIAYSNRMPGASVSESGSVSVPLLKSPTPMSVAIDLSSMNRDVDLSDLDGLWIHMPSVESGTSFSIDSIRLIPEPSSIVLISIGICMGLVCVQCGGLSRRRKNRKH